MSLPSRLVASLLAVALVAALVAALSRRGREAGGGERDEPERSVDRESPDGAELSGAACTPALGEVVEAIERTIPLDAALSVRVFEAATKRPVARARVTATIDLRWTRDRPSGIDFEREATTDGGGIARFERFPSRYGVEVRVAAEGFRLGAQRVELRKGERDRTIEFALSPGLSSAEASVRVALPAGVSLPGARVYYADEASKSNGRLPVGGYVPIADDPAARVVEHDLAIQLVLPGYAGPVQRRRFRRGTDATLAPPGRPVTQAIVLVDELGRGIEGVEVTVWPLEALVHRAQGSAASGVTDAEGVCRIDGYAGSTWELAVDETKVHATERLFDPPLAVGSPPRTIRCVRRAVERFRLDLPGVATADGRVTLDWRSFEPVPGSPVDRAFRADEAQRAEAIERYRTDLPGFSDWARDAAGAAGFSLGLAPGTYVLAPAIEGLAGRETTIEVPVGGGEVLVAFAATRRLTVQVTGSIDRADGPLPFGAIIAPRRVGWDERVALSNELDPLWRLAIARPPRRGDKDAMRDFEFTYGRALSSARGREPSIGADVVWSGFDGVAEVDVAGEPSELTVMFPGHRAVVVPLEPGSPHLRAHVEPSMFRAFEVRVRTTGGAPFGGYAVSLDSLLHLRRGRPASSGRSVTDAGGVLEVGYLPGESLGCYRGHDEWAVTTSGGATVESLVVGYSSSYVFHMPQSGTPSATLVVEPNRSR